MAFDGVSYWAILCGATLTARFFSDPTVGIGPAPIALGAVPPFAIARADSAAHFAPHHRHNQAVEYFSSPVPNHNDRVADRRRRADNLNPIALRPSAASNRYGGKDVAKQPIGRTAHTNAMQLVESVVQRTGDSVWVNPFCARGRSKRYSGTYEAAALLAQPPPHERRRGRLRTLLEDRPMAYNSNRRPSGACSTL